MRDNTAKRKLAAGQAVSVINPTYSSPGLVELLGRMGFDVIFLDCEHGPASWDAVEDMVRAAELVGATPIVRVQANDPSTITRALSRATSAESRSRTCEHPGRGGSRRPSRQVRPDRPPRLRRGAVRVRREDGGLHPPRERGDHGRGHARGGRGARQPRRRPEGRARGRLLRGARRPRPVDGAPRADGPPEGPGGDRRRRGPHRRGRSCRRRAGHPDHGPTLPRARRALPVRRAGLGAGSRREGLRGRRPVRPEASMAFIETIPLDEATGEVRAMYERGQARFGYVPDRTKLFAATSPGSGPGGRRCWAASAATWTRAATSW